MVSDTYLLRCGGLSLLVEDGCRIYEGGRRSPCRPRWLNVSCLYSGIAYGTKILGMYALSPIHNI